MAKAGGYNTSYLLSRISLMMLECAGIFRWLKRPTFCSISRARCSGEGDEPSRELSANKWPNCVGNARTRTSAAGVAAAGATGASHRASPVALCKKYVLPVALSSCALRWRGGGQAGRRGQE